MSRRLWRASTRIDHCGKQRRKVRTLVGHRHHELLHLAYRPHRICVEHILNELYSLAGLRLEIKRSPGALDEEHDDERVRSVQVAVEQVGQADLHNQ